MATVEEFSELSQEEQIARIQKLGELALEEFGVVPSEIEPLVHFENTTFKVRSSQGEFCLRVSRPGVQNLATLQSELDLLTALRSEGFRVPAPYQSRLVAAEAPGVPERRYVALFRWMNGEFYRNRLNPEVAKMIGQTMARLHEFTLHWKRPFGFERAHLHNWAIEERPTYRIDSPIEGFPEEDRLYLLELDKEARQVLSTLPRTPDTYNLIHSDLHVGNVLVEDGRLNVIDFDDLGFGFLYYDFGAALGFHLSEELYEPIKEAMLAGYEEVRPLPPNTRELLNTFIRIRMCGVSRWIMSRVDNPHLRENGPEWVQRFCAGMRMLD